MKLLVSAGGWLSEPHRARHTTIALVADLGPDASTCVDVLGTSIRAADEWIRIEAAHALWRVTGDPAAAVAVLTELSQPLAQGDCRSVRIAALRHLADIGVVDDRIRSLAQAIVDNPRRIAYFGGWRTFTEDERITTAALTLSRTKR